MYVQGVSHVALDVASPPRTADFLQQVFGFQTLRQGYWKGEYIWMLGSPDPERINPVYIVLHLRPGLLRGRLNYVALDVGDQGVQAAAQELQEKGIYVDVDGDYMLYAPEELRIKLGSLTNPPPIPDDPTVITQTCPVDPDLPCMVQAQRISHVAIDVGSPTRMQDWLCNTFGFDGKRKFARRGEFISGVYYEHAPKDPQGRSPGLFAIFLRGGLRRVRLNHVAFEVEDPIAAMAAMEAKGIPVNMGNDAMIHGPEDIWYQLDSRTNPIPVGHPANDGGVRYTDPPR